MTNESADKEKLEKLKRLREPFEAKSIGKLPRSKCQACSKASSRVCAEHTKKKCWACNNYMTTAHIDLDFVGHAVVTARLLDVDPLWTWTPMAVDEFGGPAIRTDKDGSKTLWINLTVLGVTRPGVGSVLANAFDPEKQLIGDAIRNAAMRFGVALDLWTKEELEDSDEHGTQESKSESQKPAAAEPTYSRLQMEAKRQIDELDSEAQDKVRAYFKEENWPHLTQLTDQQVNELLDVIGLMLEPAA